MGLTVFFDFDGTLVDSAPGILQGYQLVLQSEHIQPVVEVGTYLIGPPLAQTLAQITGEQDPVRLARLVECFKSAYDSEGYKATLLYADVLACLQALRDAGHRLVLLTNKRRVPTLKILEYFHLQDCFSAVYTPDSWQPPVKRKNDTMERALAELQADPARCVMVGDSSDDAHAAADHGVAFVAAAYGYGDGAVQGDYPRAAIIEGLTQLPAVVGQLEKGSA